MVTQQPDESIRFIDLLMIGIGCAMFAFGLVFFNIANHLADGGISGITLIFRALFHIDPAYSTILINVPLIIIGWRFLGRQSLIYTIYGTGMLSLCLWVWQRVPLTIALHGDLLLSALGAGIIGGFGSGLLYRYGGTTGGTDIIARIFERFRGVPMGRTLLYLDVVVLLISLVYIDIQHMAYTLIYSYVFARIVNFTQEGAYAARGVIVVSENYQQITNEIMTELERGVSLINGEGGFSHQERKMIYVVVAPSELYRLRQIIQRNDSRAFISVINVNEALGEGFSFGLPDKGWLNQFRH
ncbi:YitT family protein [Levilactobacillus brevis]|uniref:YitT family protein n=1 Tax=Levilactobacillus brevis TaxID=1580 RepID=UPI001C1E9AA3|nr:YitT family protein [Levilactobacillus brevis]MBU7538724.1 YitT family protein [Levilactobacillus brevis]MBU7558365.1 YitT family protein [Levilactobacillus brevis]MBU7564954.1 YitT family protein [Levilactobacillus brevis]MCE6009990.1 YitT family protein [Levilactobacillus brevis]MCE6012276.1 YitT family protein [Levilactobacillus brevis]